MIFLDKRLRAVVDNIEGNVLADIGCDHGKVCTQALKEKRVNRVIASDISEKSVSKARELLSKNGLLDRAIIRVGDGFEGYSDNEVDCVVIAGMGGTLIKEILQNEPKGIEKYILVAHKDAPKLRKYLIDKEKKIIKDYIVKCNDKFYNIIVAIKGHQDLSYKAMMLGMNSLENKDFAEYLEYEYNKRGKIINNMGDKAENSDMAAYYNLLKDVVEGNK